MLVGVPKEIKDNEYRVGIVPSTVRELTDKGHQVLVETGAGVGAGLPDGDYQAAGAEIVSDADAVFSRAELIVKVKEPLAAERKKLRRGQVLFAYLHLAPDRALSEELMAAGVTAIAYETVTSHKARCHCSRQCRKSPAAWRRMSARTAWKKRMAAAECYSPAYQASLRRALLFSAAASRERTRRRSPLAWVPMSQCSIATPRRYAASPPNWAAMCARCFPPAMWLSCSAGAPISSSLPSSCPARPRQN